MLFENIFSKIFSIFKKGLQKTAVNVSRTISGIFTGEKKWDASSFEELEFALIAADFGVKAFDKIHYFSDHYCYPPCFKLIYSHYTIILLLFQLLCYNIFEVKPYESERKSK